MASASRAISRCKGNTTNIPKADLDRARAMTLAGMSPIQISEETGWDYGYAYRATRKVRRDGLKPKRKLPKPTVEIVPIGSADWAPTLPPGAKMELAWRVTMGQTVLTGVSRDRETTNRSVALAKKRMASMMTCGLGDKFHYAIGRSYQQLGAEAWGRAAQL